MYDENSEFDLTHKELVLLTKATLNKLIETDKNLNDLPADVTLEEINAHIAVECGQSMTVYVVRDDGDEIPVIVKQGVSRVIDLKKSFQSVMTLKLRRSGENAKISWRHVWRIYWLSFNGVRLQTDKEFLKEYGIVNKSRVSFVKKLK